MSEHDKTPTPSRWFEGGWHRDLMRNAMVYVPPGNYPEFGADVDWSKIEGVITMPYYVYRQLIDYIAKNEPGIIRTDRVEDLKIINRLIDVVQAQVGK